jgi:hypothetical protein
MRPPANASTSICPPNAVGAEAEALGDELVDEAERDRQAAAGLHHRGEVAVQRRVIILGVPAEAFFLEEHVVQVGEDRLRLPPADARAHAVAVALELRVDLIRVDVVDLVHRDGDRALQQRVGGVQHGELTLQEIEPVGRAAKGKLRCHGALLLDGRRRRFSFYRQLDGPICTFCAAVFPCRRRGGFGQRRKTLV